MHAASARSVGVTICVYSSATNYVIYLPVYIMWIMHNNVFMACDFAPCVIKYNWFGLKQSLFYVCIAI